jgi:hypothetical protein
MNKIITSVFVFLLFLQSSVFTLGYAEEVEEVLSGIEFTPEHLVISVARCGTHEGKYRIDIDNDLLTVYLTDRKQCRALVGPRPLYFSREELGIGKYDRFTLKNKITSSPRG